jgi:hypothetical protein
MHAQALQAVAARTVPASFVSLPPSTIRYRSRHGQEMVVTAGSADHRRFEASGRWSRVVEEEVNV